MRGQKLMAMVASLSLTCINRGEDPTFIGRGRGSVVDVSFASEGLVRRIEEWRVLPTDFASDHCGISITIWWGNKDQMGSNAIWRPNEIQAQRVAENCAARLELAPPEGPEILMAVLTEECACAAQTQRPRRKRAYWWTEEIPEL